MAVYGTPTWSRFEGSCLWGDRIGVLSDNVVGSSLLGYVDQPTGCPFDNLLGGLDGVISALVYLHAHRVYHGDLEPGSIVVREDGAPMIMWAGIAPLLEGDARRCLNAGLPLRRT